jgi:glycosyltransferase involved in cell wall biosynthesis
MNDTLVDGVTAVVVPSHSPQRLAEAILSLHANPDKRAELGRNAQALARRHYDADTNAREVLGLYRSVLNGTWGGQA